MKYLKLFNDINSYGSYIDSSNYITPHVALCINEKEIKYKPKSIFPLHLTVNRSWEEVDQYRFKYYYYEILLPNNKLYKELEKVFILQNNMTHLYALPDGWLDEHPIDVDGHKVTSIIKEYDRIYFHIEGDYPYNDIINRSDMLITEYFTAMDEPLRIIAYVYCGL